MNVLKIVLIAVLFSLYASSAIAERFPINLIDDLGEGRTGALIIAYATGDTVPVDTAYEQGDGNYWFEVSGDSGWTPGFYDVYYDLGDGQVLPDSWTNTYIGFGNVPELNSIDSTHVKDGGLIGNDLKSGAVDSRELADSVSFTICRATDWLLADDWTKLQGPTWLGGAVGDSDQFRRCATS